MADLDPTSVPAEFIKEGADWLAVFNPRVQRVMDVKLEAKFVHDSVRFSNDGRHVAVGLDGEARVYEVGTERAHVLSLTYDGEIPERNYVRSVAFSPDDVLVAGGAEDALIRVWSVTSNELLHTLHGHTQEIYALEFISRSLTPTSSAYSIASSSGDRSIHIWSLPDQSLSPTSSPITISGTPLVVSDDLQSPNTVITALAVSPDGRYIASGNLEGHVRLWSNSESDSTPATTTSTTITTTELGVKDGEGREWTPLVRWQAHEEGVYSIRWATSAGIGSGREAGIVTGSLDRTLKRWAVILPDEEEGRGPNAECVRTMAGHQDFVLAAATVQEGLNLRAASASRDGRVRLWDLKSGEIQFVVQGHRNAVTSVDLSKDGTMLLSGSGDGEARLWSYTIL